MSENSDKIAVVNPNIFQKVCGKQDAIHAWLNSLEGSNELPLYSSVDIRDAGFKIAVVDTNIFPAGFNNLCEHGLEDAVALMRAAILKRVAHCQDILLITEEHTRNVWYLENIRILQEIITKAGFNAKIATFMTVQPDFCNTANYVELETATGQPVRIFCLKKLLAKFEAGAGNYDLIILNNDLTTGIPEILKNSKIPIYPSIQAGWHSRLKSHHFRLTQELMEEFARIVDLDPWFFSAYYDIVDNVDINNEIDRMRLFAAATELFAKISQKYQNENICEKPYIVLKSDSGTYGMGVMTIHSPQDILDLNRKEKNRLHVGKGSQIIDRYLLQEGVPTIHNVDNQVSEICLYQIDNNFVGGFYRSHAQKGERDNLNSQGAEFKRMCPHLKKYGEGCVHDHLTMFDIYRIIVRIAGIAAHREIIQLEANAR
jgi:glutamate--cysteine ligase